MLVGGNFGFDSIIPVGSVITAITAYVKDRDPGGSGFVQRYGSNQSVVLKVSGVAKAQDTSTAALSEY